MAYQRRVRIGIDVGGTFTDAVAIDNDTLEIIGQVKVFTTHFSSEGVARGIVDALEKLLRTAEIPPEAVVFIAHGTTQATNALLEGDVAQVGIVGMGSGFDGMRAKGQTAVGDIQLAPGRWLHTYHVYLDSARLSGEALGTAIEGLVSRGASVIVATEPFSVDDPTDEKLAMDAARAMGYPASGTHEISKLYGLKIRTRTAVVNASILPRMMETANLTESAIEKASIQAPLMIMRCDGGVMDVDEMRNRPILTILSGPAAGVAGALMYEKVSDGIFLEVGGTSTDISAIQNGRVMLKYAEVGGHKTYLNSLDVRTVGLAGGSMIRVADQKVETVGPRSAHIAGLGYSVFQKPDDIVDPDLLFVQPKAGDPDNYVAIRTKSGQTYALTLSCAANIAGEVKEGDYAWGNVESARRAFAPLAHKLGVSVDEAAIQVLDRAVDRVRPTIESLIRDYELDRDHAILVGGGGGCAAVVPYLARKMGLRHRISENCQVISTIGVALALVRDVVERTITNPSADDVLRIRKEAEAAAIKAGAAPASVEVHVTVDTQRSVVRAVAVGATEMRARDRSARELSEDECRKIAADSLRLPPHAVTRMAETPNISCFSGLAQQSLLQKLVGGVRTDLRAVDREGVLRLQVKGGQARTTNMVRALTDLRAQVDANTSYGDAGAILPNVFVILGARILDLSGLASLDQVASLAQAEIAGHGPDEPVVIITSKR
jgi:N-methylhydantoinase A